MSKYILNTLSEELRNSIDSELKASVCFPLVREIEFKYGLKVYHFVKTGIVTKKSKTQFYLCYPNGMHCGIVFNSTESTPFVPSPDEDTSEVVYNFKTPLFRKSRASNESERTTVSSKKISALMATIKKHKVIKPFAEVFEEKYQIHLRSCIRSMKNHFGNTSKHTDLNMDVVHALVATALGENPNRYGLSLDLNLCKILLDKFNKADSIHAEKLSEISRFFDKPYYAIGTDKLGHHIVGKLKRVNDSMEIVQDFCRVRSLDHFTDLTPILTMMKVANESKGGKDYIADNQYNFINESMYDPALDVIYYAIYYRDETDLHWTLIPCP